MTPKQTGTDMKVALVGLGYWGSKLLRNLVELVGSERVVAVDAHLDQVALACAHYPAVAARISLEDALSDESVRAVIVATPPETHTELCEQALLAGRQVLVEKPLATSVAEAEGLVHLAEERGLVLQVGHTFLFSPRVAWLKDFVQGGGIGRVHYLTSSRLNLGTLRSDANVIWDLAPHDFSIMFHVLGEFPVCVQTSARSVVRPGTPEVAFINLTFPSGAIASVAVSWLAPRKVRNLVIVGDRNMVVYDDTEADEPIKVHDRGVVLHESANFGDHQLTYRYGDTMAPYVPVQEPLSLQLADFLSSIGKRRADLSDGRFGLRVVEALEAADRSWNESSAPITLAAPDRTLRREPLNTAERSAT